MSNDPLTDEQRDGALGAVVVALGATGEVELMELSDALRRGGDLTAIWDEYESVIVSLAVPAGHPLRNIAELEERVFDLESRAVATCGLYVRSVRITLALARDGWRRSPSIGNPTSARGLVGQETVRHHMNVTCIGDEGAFKSA